MIFQVGLYEAKEDLFEAIPVQEDLKHFGCNCEANDEAEDDSTPLGDVQSAEDILELKSKGREEGTKGVV